ncbi:hypothetical protein ASZ90_006236 [hydrocarbon metagenome]|uniref:Uncharacterized protein n=1 Tax=hydrocarbon metagenome TaxID=938273 RepID=A0A0W8FSW4_9ZZZZ
MQSFLDKIKKDMKKSWAEGLAAVMQGANVVSGKMNELSEEGKKQYQIFNLHVKIKDQMNELGEIAYAVLKKGKNLDEDKKVKAAFAKIEKLEWQLSKITDAAKIKSIIPKKAAKKTVKKRK